MWVACVSFFAGRCTTRLVRHTANQLDPNNRERTSKEADSRNGYPTRTCPRTAPLACACALVAAGEVLLYCGPTKLTHCISALREDVRSYDARTATVDLLLATLATQVCA